MYDGYTYSFEMPESDLTLTATSVKNESDTVWEIKANEGEYKWMWYGDDVVYVESGGQASIKYILKTLTNMCYMRLYL